MRYRLLLIALVLPMMVRPVEAGIGLFGRKKDAADPKARVPELISSLKSDRDADARARAAEELRNYDPTAHPEIIAALSEALLTDSKPNVRTEAAASLGKIRPVSQNAGEALEAALANDSSMRVRLQARSALLSYHWAGYRNGKKDDVPPLTPPGKEPPPVSTAGVAAPTTPRTNAVSPTVTNNQPVPQASNNSSRFNIFPSLRSSNNSGTIRSGQQPVQQPGSIPTALTPPVPSTKEPPLATPLSQGEMKVIPVPATTASGKPQVSPMLIPSPVKPTFSPASKTGTIPVAPPAAAPTSSPTIAKPLPPGPVATESGPDLP